MQRVYSVRGQRITASRLLGSDLICRWAHGIGKRCHSAVGERVEWLPKYAPELNDIEVVWHDLKAHHLAHQTFTNVEALDREIHTAVEALNQERNVDSLVNWRISA